MTLPVTSFVAAVLGLLLIALAGAVVGKRVRSGHAFGDGGDVSLLRVIRAHGNLSEYAPVFLVLLALLEARAVDVTVLRALGAVFVLSRLVAVVYSFGRQLLALRIVAFWTSALPIVVASVWLLATRR